MEQGIRPSTLDNGKYYIKGTVIVISFDPQ